MSIADRPLIFLRHDSSEALNSFKTTFGHDFQIAAFQSDEAAAEALANLDIRPAALFVLVDNPSARTEFPLLAKARVSHPDLLKILLGDSIPLSLLVNLLDLGQVDRCFEQPVNPDLIRSHVLRAALAVQKMSGVAVQVAPSGADEVPAVLIVDDESAATKYLARQLEHMQDEFQVLCADHAEAALELMREQGDRIAVIMTDQRMPGMHGKELLDELRQSHPCTVRILTSAYGEVAVAMDAVNEGEIFRYQKKPWRAVDCLSLFREALARRRQLLSELNQTRSALDHQLEALYKTRTIQLLALEPLINEAAGLPVLASFLQALQTIKPLPANASHLRASLETDLEHTLIEQFCDLARHRLTQLMRMPGGTLSAATLQTDLQTIADAGDDIGEPQSVSACLAQALTTLLTASGQHWQHIVFSRPETGVEVAHVSLHMYTHLLAPLSRVSRPLLEQQVAFLLLHVASARLGCELKINGGQQLYTLTLSLPDTAETD
ncbi:response regulator [Allohahella marinimesophila]|uniref:Response regulatory domain-containing protein n=1 Tax=Allohahella marinimesophila TaxID=1054972 RepID=A0ABP7NJA9_9GAMM